MSTNKYIVFFALFFHFSGLSNAQVDVWKPIGPYAATVFSHAIHPTDSNTVYVGCFFNGIYRSTNGGLSWSHQNSGFGSAFVPAMCADPLTPGTFYAGTFERGVYKTTDGSTWGQTNNGLDALNIVSLAISPINSERLIACSFLGPYQTINGATQWESFDKSGLYELLVFEDIPVANIPDTGSSTQRRLIIASNSASQTVYFKWFNDLLNTDRFNQITLTENEAATLLTVLNGESWDVNNMTPEVIDGIIEDALTLTENPVTLTCLSAVYSRVFETVAYLGTEGNGAYITIDGGAVWKPWNEGIEDHIVFDLKLHPDFEVVYAATNKGVFTRGAADSAWSSIKFNLLDTNVTGLSFLNNGRILASSGVGVFALDSVDDTIWDLWYDTPARSTITFPGSSRTIVAGTTDTLDMTLDNGISFQSVIEGIQNNFPDALALLDPNGTNTLLAGLDTGIWRTNDTFVPTIPTWQSAESIKEHLIAEITPHPTRETHVYAGTERAGVWFSDDSAATWTQRTNGIHPITISDISQAPVGDHTYYCATEVGLFRSDDDGRYWRLATPDALPTIVTAVETDVVKPGFAYYGTSSGILAYTPNDKDFFRFAELSSSIRAIRSVPFEGVYVILEDGTILSSRNDSLDLAPRNDGISHPVLDLQVNHTQTNIAYSATAGGGVYKTVSEGTQWTQIDNGIENQYIFSLTIDRNNENRLFAAATGEVFRTEDAGATWTKISTTGLPTSIAITNITLDPSSSDTLYCSAFNTGVFFSTDGGINWTDTGLPSDASSGVLPIVHSTNQAGELFVGSSIVGTQLWSASSNTWQRSGNGMSDLVRGIEISQNTPDQMYAATLNSGVFSSTDAGLNWTFSGLAGRRSLHMAMNPQNDFELLVGTTNGLAGSSDGGSTWYDIGQRVAFASTLAFTATNPKELLIGGSGGLIYSTPDSGRTWQSRSDDLPENEVTVIKSTPDDGLFASVEFSGIYRSLDNGLSWSLISDTLLASERVTAIATESTFHQLFIATQQNGLFSCGMTGNDLAQLTLPRENYIVDPITQVIVDPLSINTVFVSRANQSEAEQSIHRSTNRGLSWTTPSTDSGLPAGSVFAIVASPHNHGEVLCAHKTGIFRSTDSGTTWSPTINANATINAIHYDTNITSQVYASIQTGGLLYSQDGGINWQESDLSTGIVVNDIQNSTTPGEVFASTANRGLISSLDYGASWTTGIEPALTTPAVTYIAINPVNPQNILLATGGEGVLRSYDGGRNLERVNNGLNGNASLLSVLINPQDPDVIYAGTVNDGIYVSENQGTSWTALNDGRFHELTIAMELDPINPRRIYAGFEGGGVYQLEHATKFLRPDSDHDLDGIVSIWEQYLNLDPLSPNTVDSNLTTVKINATNPIRMRWLKGTQTPEEPVNAEIEWSRDLSQWFTLQTTPSVDSPYGTFSEISQEGDYSQMEATITDSNLEEQLFLRLKLTR